MLLFASHAVCKSKNPYQCFLPLRRLQIRASSTKVYGPKQILPKPQELRTRLALAVGCGGLPSQHLEEKTPLFYSPKGWHKCLAISTSTLLNYTSLPNIYFSRLFFHKCLGFKWDLNSVQSVKTHASPPFLLPSIILLSLSLSLSLKPIAVCQ